MVRTYILLSFLILIVFGLAACGGDEKADSQATAQAPAMSGRIEAGLRVLTFDAAEAKQDFRIYRGDYVRPEMAGGGSFTIEIADLGVDQAFPVAEGERPYFKVPDTGSFTYRIGDLTGVIEAIDYTAANYREVSAKEAAGVIANLDPFVLDVRSDREFKSGHIEGATLIPVQVLKNRVGEIAGHKDQPVLIYCASGNRSTVAARILAAAGFKQIINLRKGIKGWSREKLPVVK